MRKMIVALLASGLMGSALAQSAPPADPQQQPQAAPPAAAPAPSVPGAKGATVQSLGEMVPYYVIGGVAVVGAIVAASSGGSDHKASTPPVTGTTGTTGTL